jgi:hypothetical protein
MKLSASVGFHIDHPAPNRGRKRDCGNRNPGAPFGSGEPPAEHYLPFAFPMGFK